jgi:hypothetical protein
MPNAQLMPRAAPRAHRAGLGAADTRLGFQQLDAPTHLLSPNGVYELRVQTDGNLVLYANGAPYWDTHTHNWHDYSGENLTDVRLIFQSDGDLVLFLKVHQWVWGFTVPSTHDVWRSGTSGSGADALALDNTGNLTLYRGPNIVWDTNRSLTPQQDAIRTAAQPPAPPPQPPKPITTNPAPPTSSGTSTTAKVATSALVVGGTAAAGVGIWAWLTHQAYGAAWKKIWNETGGRAYRAVTKKR